MDVSFRYAAPLPIATDRTANFPGEAKWVMAFTTAGRERSEGLHDTRHLHCSLLSTSLEHQQQSGLVQWRLETQPMDPAYARRGRAVEGKASSLQLAQEAVVEAALQSHIGEDTTRLSFGPAFAALAARHGQPRIWGCAAVLKQPGEHKNSQQSYLSFIRERLGGQQPIFLCSLEEGEEERSRLLRRWTCDSLSDASKTSCAAIVGSNAQWKVRE